MQVPFWRILEISLYALANFIPYLILAIYTFHRHFRFSNKVTGVACILATGIQIVTRFWAAYQGEGSSTITLIRTVSYLILFLITVNRHWGKILFVLLIFSNLSNFISIAATYLESVFMSDGIVHRLYCWHPALIMIVLHLCLTLPFALVVRKMLLPLIDRGFTGHEWYYFWIVPGIFQLIWQYHIYGSYLSTMEIISDVNNIIFLTVITLGGHLTYYIIIRFNEQLARNLDIERIKRYHDIERIAYQTLHERMEETRRSRHDLRHHVLVMSDYLEHQEYDALKEYLDSYKKTIPENTNYLFCSNRAVNRLLLFFAMQAQENDIDFDVQLSIPEELPVSESDISVLLGNLLENALEACLEQNSCDRKIIISGKGDKHSLFFTIDNTCENEVKKNAKGEFISTKEKGNGIGISSAEHIVKRYKGLFQAEKKENMFYVSFMLTF